MKLQRGGDATQVLQAAKHKLFVEGKDNQEIDPAVIHELLNNNGLTAIEVQSMGCCDNVRSAAQALIHQHPAYYFLIDRDDQDQTTVDQSWAKFPDPTAFNMLIWRKRELENYFIDPDYIEKSSFLKPGIDVRQRILDVCCSRLFLDAANLTLLYLNRKLRKPLAIGHFANPEHFKNESEGVLQLEQLSGFTDKKSSVVAVLEKDFVKQAYSDFVNELSAGVYPLRYGSGSWLERMSGKEIFRVIANECFQVRNASNVLLQGKEQNKQIAKELVNRPLAEQPPDFQSIVDALKKRVK
ncbi:MAG: hypothetical protein U1D70_04090 [Methylobacter sp.]|nr:hypothetical protein [Methylobacter sp.]MDP2429192.1 hypothetical protein [Methylobacter sp.]MDP3056288.1 hypothetical protein [Methylobacter sp.]MDP3362322.1 hypothetical protein [Methylobacter sp.]MDZ4218186.1 hypothetical protein [Methylobacter sp.]